MSQPRSKGASLSAQLLARKGQAGPSRLHTPVHRPLRPISGVTGSGHFDIVTKAINPIDSPEKATEPMIRKTIRLPKSVEEGLRLLAARDRISQQALVIKLVEDLLRQEADTDGCLCGRVASDGRYSGARAKQS